jgi:hypothetical protein
MNTKLISPKWHGLLDYALVSSLLTVPTLLNFNKKAKIIYAAEALTLLAYVALTEQPAAVKPLIPFTTHGKIDPFNVGQFALQSLLPAFRKDKKALWFNIGFTALAGFTVLLTDWKGRTQPVKI